jgi:ribonucleoside-diphosphate reductase alpha chain
LLCDKFSRTRFEPYGFTENPDIPRASSIMDYLFRWLGSKFVREATPVEAAPDATTTAADREIEKVGEVIAAAQKVEVVDMSQAGKANGRNGNGAGHANGNGSAHTGNGNYSFIARTDAPTCPECGSIMIPNGSCHKCVNCGTTSGCS